jgi:hypothetical protein
MASAIDAVSFAVASLLFLGYCAGRQLAAVPAGDAHRSTRGTQRSVTRRDELWKTRVPFSLTLRVVTELAVASTAATSV